jgi:5-formyltetrahydrofolate cyclo-ligase
MRLGADLSSKAAVRQAVRAARAALPDKQRRARSAAITRRVVRLKVFREAETVLAYRSVGSEVVTDALIRAALRAGKRVALPVSLKRSRRLVFRQIRSLDHDLVPGLAGIPEPKRTCPAIAGREADVVVVPGVAFDEEGWRIGAGAGFYDRFLAKIPRVPRIGLAFEAQIVPGVPHNDLDERLDMIVTEQRVIRCRGRRRNAK